MRFDVKIKMIGFRRVGVTYVYRAVQPRLYYVVSSVLGMKGSLVAGWLVLYPTPKALLISKQYLINNIYISK